VGLATACDQGTQHDQTVGGEAPIHVVATNFAAQPLAPGASIELAFDRLLMPASILRQSFVLQDLRDRFLEPAVAYDPVARVVTITPAPDDPLLANQIYKLTIHSPQGPSDPLGLRAIDGATLDPSQPSTLDVQVGPGPAGADGGAGSSADAGPGGDAGGDASADAGAGGDGGTADGGGEAGAGPGRPTVDFCADVVPLFATRCSGSNCHGGTNPAAGLLLTAAGVPATAIDKVAHGANTGPLAAPAPPAVGGDVHLVFGVDMPIVDRATTGGGNPGDSWMMYKLLLAPPPPTAAAPDAGAAGDAGPGVSASSAHSVAWQPLSDAERAALSDLVPGREMPFPTNPDPRQPSTAALTVDELERVSLWIAEGAPTPSCP